jgi:hypothetical protein
MNAPPDTTGEPVVKVTLAAIYEKVLDVDRKLDPIPRAVADHETRIRALERHMWLWLGAASVGGGAVTTLITRAITGG